MTIPSVERGEHVFDRFLVREALHENGLSVQFNVWQCVPSDVSDGSVWIKGGIISESDDEVFSDSEIEKIIEGTVNWEGCANLMMSGGGFAHFCEWEDAVAIGPLMRHVHERALTLMGDKAIWKM